MDAKKASHSKTLFLRSLAAEDMAPKASVVIPNYNGARWLPDCLDALAGQQFDDFEVIVVDNGSTDGSVTSIENRHLHVRLISLRENTGFARAVNRGIRETRADYVALLNNDTVVRPQWLGALVQLLEASSHEVAAVASLMLSLDEPNLVDDAGDCLSWTGAAEKVGHGRPADEFRTRREVFSPSGGATLYRRSFLEQMGGFDEHFFAYLEDIDLGLRGRLAGYRYLLEPEAEVLHKGHGSAIRRRDYVRLLTKNRLMVFAKNVPSSLLLKHLLRLIYGQLYFFVAYKHPFQSLAGYVSFLVTLPHIFRERRRVSRLRRISTADLDAMLTVEMSEPPLHDLLTRYLRDRRS